MTVNAITVTTVITIVIVAVPPFRPKVDSAARINGSWCVRTRATSDCTPLQTENRDHVHWYLASGDNLRNLVVQHRSDVVAGELFAAFQKIELDHES